LALDLDVCIVKEYSNETREDDTLSMKDARVLLFAPEGEAKARTRANAMMIFFLMITMGIAEVVPEKDYWFLKASRTFSSSSRLPISTCLGLEPS